MTTKEVSDMIKSVGVPYAYYQFDEDTAEPPPFICFYYPASANFKADDIIYVRGSRLNIELYTREKDFDLESAVETVLTKNGLVYESTETFIESEKLHLKSYYTEITLTEESNG